VTLAAAGHGFLSPSGVEIAFLLVGVMTLGSAVITVTTKQLVHAALWLVLALGGLAVEYLLLTAEFIAWVQVLIYVGSVVVLLLFGLMLTRAPIGPSPDADSGNRRAALVVALAAAAALIWVVVDAFRSTRIDLGGPAQGSTAVSGESLFRHWVLPFEALSVLLLAALVGAIVLSRLRAPTDSPGLLARLTAQAPADSLRLRSAAGAGDTADSSPDRNHRQDPVTLHTQETPGTPKTLRAPETSHIPQNPDTPEPPETPQSPATSQPATPEGTHPATPTPEGPEGPESPAPEDAHPEGPAGAHPGVATPEGHQAPGGPAPGGPAAPHRPRGRYGPVSPDARRGAYAPGDAPGPSRHDPLPDGEETR
jgi:NADH-quinone oxidoreductase subunit J